MFPNMPFILPLSGQRPILQGEPAGKSITCSADSNYYVKRVSHELLDKWFPIDFIPNSSNKTSLKLEGRQLVRNNLRQ